MGNMDIFGNNQVRIDLHRSATFYCILFAGFLFYHAIQVGIKYGFDERVMFWWAGASLLAYYGYKLIKNNGEER